MSPFSSGGASFGYQRAGRYGVPFSSVIGAGGSLGLSGVRGLSGGSFGPGTGGSAFGVGRPLSFGGLSSQGIGRLPVGYIPRIGSGELGFTRVGSLSPVAGAALAPGGGGRLVRLGGGGGGGLVRPSGGGLVPVSGGGLVRLGGGGLVTLGGGHGPLVRLGGGGRNANSEVLNSAGDVRNVNRNVRGARMDLSLARDRGNYNGMQNAAGDLAGALSNRRNARGDLAQNRAEAGLLQRVIMTGGRGMAGGPLGIYRLAARGRGNYNGVLHGAGDLANALGNRRNARGDLTQNRAEAGLLPRVEMTGGRDIAGGPLGGPLRGNPLGSPVGQLGPGIDRLASGPIDPAGQKGLSGGPAGPGVSMDRVAGNLLQSKGELANAGGEVFNVQVDLMNARAEAPPGAPPSRNARQGVREAGRLGMDIPGGAPSVGPRNANADFMNFKLNGNADFMNDLQNRRQNRMTVNRNRGI